MTSAYDTVSGLARAAILLLVATIALYIVAVVSDLSQLELHIQIEEGREISEAEIESNDNRQELIGNLQSLLILPTAVVFLMWIYRAHRKLPALGARELRFTPGWAVGWWFIPIFNASRPHQIVREIWRASDPAVTDALGWRQAPSSPLIGWWWALFLVSFMHFAIGDTALGRGGFIIVSDLSGIVGAFLAILLIRRIDARQTEKIKLVTSETPPALSAD